MVERSRSEKNDSFSTMEVGMSNWQNDGDFNLEGFIKEVEELKKEGWISVDEDYENYMNEVEVDDEG